MERAAHDDGESDAALSGEAVRRIARLSRLSLDEARVEALGHELGMLLGYVGRLAAAGGDGCCDEPAADAGALRGDEPGGTLEVDVVMGLARGARPPYFGVPRVLGDGGGA